MAGLRMPLLPWDEGADVPVTPAPGGLLDGLPDFDAGDGLSVLMKPKDIAGISSPEGPSSDPGPMPPDTQAGQAIGQKSSPNGEGEYSPDDQNGPAPDRKDPADKSNLGVGDVVGKLWNLPNSVIGLGYGAAGYLAGWPSHWLGLQDEAPGITSGNNAVQFTYSPLMAPGSAITLGNAQVFHGEPTDPGDYRDPPTPIGEHEEPHTYQGQQLGPLYLPSNILGGLAAELIDGNWHGPHNWNEVGPQQRPPVPWPK